MFKNTFGVTGSRKQLEAFAEAAEGLGWKKNNMIQWGRTTRIFFHQEDGYNYCTGFSGNYPTYSLPTQWSEAIATASEVEEVKFEVGKKYKHIEGELIVLCCGFTDEEKFRATVIKDGCANTVGKYSDQWSKCYFTPYLDTITI